MWQIINGLSKEEAGNKRAGRVRRPMCWWVGLRGVGRKQHVCGTPWWKPTSPKPTPRRGRSTGGGSGRTTRSAWGRPQGRVTRSRRSAFWAIRTSRLPLSATLEKPRPGWLHSPVGQVAWAMHLATAARGGGSAGQGRRKGTREGEARKSIKESESRVLSIQQCTRQTDKISALVVWLSKWLWKRDSPGPRRAKALHLPRADSRLLKSLLFRRGAAVTAGGHSMPRSGLLP
jgi:hypothetical protein